MNISLQWLQAYVDAPASADELSDLLTSVGLEVEAVEDGRGAYPGIVVGEVRTCEKHLNADKLSVCTVFDGVETRTVVCGAPNVAAGQKVMFARPGAVLAKAGFTIAARVIRGVESHGMICSTSELGLDGDHSGIAVLDPAAEPGMPIARHLGIDDVVFQIGITPNRGDALSHVGVARDVSARLGLPLRIPQPELPTVDEAQLLSIDIRDASLCPRYSAAIVDGVTNGPSPDWMQRALTAAGVRPISVLVDITNYVMLEIGQPMHAFDRRTLEGDSIVARVALPGEQFTTLDGRAHELRGGELLICDSVKPIAVAGVMGGQTSAVAEDTSAVLLESAYFQASSVRRTARHLGLSTDSSFRFERGTDPGATMWALQRAVSLMIAHAGGTLRGVYDACPLPIEERRVRLRPDRVNALLGITIQRDEQHRILEALQVRCTEEGDSFLCAVPTFRSDIEREIDLVEEIARIHGYNNIPTPSRIAITMGEDFDEHAFPSTVRTTAIGLGFDEILSSSLVARRHAAIGSEDAVVDVLNPVSRERPSLRTSLLPSLLEAIDLNVRNGLRTLRIVEIGNVFNRTGEGMEERKRIAFAVTGQALGRGWHSSSRPFDIFDLKGVLESFFAILNLDNDIAFSYDADGTLSGTSFSIALQGVNIGVVQQLPRATCADFGIDQEVFSAEFDLAPLEAVSRSIRRYRPVNRNPIVNRDLAVLVGKNVRAASILEAARSAGGDFLISVRLIDVFEHESLGERKKSVALALAFQAADRTMLDSEITAGVEGILQQLENRFQATLRA
jgi:phenylalanyl-tRNA synthetase beta chain